MVVNSFVFVTVFLNEAKAKKKKKKRKKRE